MKKLTIWAATALFAAVGATTVAEAHHSFSMFDHNEELVLEGTINRWAFNSPHVLFFVKDAAGTQFVFEGAAPPALLNQEPPMDGSTFTEGQKVTVVYCPLKDGRNGGGIGLVITEDGTVYTPADGGCPNARSRANPWPEWIKAGYKSLSEAKAATGAN